MSARAAAWAWQILPSLSVPGEKLVLLRLADRADPAGKCWPGHEKTAADLGISETTVKNAIRGLESAGLIQIERQKIGGRDATNIYHLQIDGEGANSAPRGAKNDDFKGAEFAPESKYKENLSKESARARSRGGFEIDPQGIHHDPADPRDQAAIDRINQYSSLEIMLAAKAAAELDDAGRAFPSGVLKILLKNKTKTKSDGHGGSAWSRGAFTNLNRDMNRNRGDDELIIEI